jgi:ADP-dependent NAD(P)H-hydrate dehydratase / NAD(P)H-hydrate epimerase
MHGLKVISSDEMARIEKLAFDSKKKIEYIEKAANSLAQKVIEISSLKKSKKIVLLLGKGNNAADGLLTSILLIKKGYEVKALQLFDEKLFSKECLYFFKILQKENLVEKIYSHENLKIIDLKIQKDEIILDAIFGTGFKGEPQGVVLDVISFVNKLDNLKISIDIPSGLDGSTGKAKVAIKADYTLYIELPKNGFFLNQGWDLIGKLIKIDLGLSKECIEKAKSDFYLLDEKTMPHLLPKIVKSRNKYEAGYVVGISGSSGMEGAANLSGKAALRSGAGIVKLFLFDYENEKEEMIDELVKMDLDLSKKDEISKTCNSAKALFIGPGLGRSLQINDFLSFLIPQIKVPLVLDADGLYFFSMNLSTHLPKNTVMTPHKKEMFRLLHEECSDDALIEKTQKFVDKYQVVLVLKGGPTFLFSPKEKPIIVMRGDPGMAKAGTGDVLTGIIAAFLAQGLKTFDAAALGVYVHALAGEEVVKEKTAYSLIASDLIEALPHVFKKMISSL